MPSNKKQWSVISSKEIFRAGFFRMRCDELQMPDGRVQPRYYTMEFADWVNIVALTDKNEMILIRQYRPPVGRVCIEIPGGATEPGSGETTDAAAARELLEETGYAPREMKLLAWHHPNPALQANKLWTYLALGCVKTAEQNLDAFEDVEVFTVPVKEAFEMIKSGEINHSLVMTGIFLALRYLDLKA